MKGIDKILVTGGWGFIGSNLLHHLFYNGFEGKLANIDNNSYAANRFNISCKKDIPTYIVDVAKPGSVSNILKNDGYDVIFHLAAETHVDRSLKDAAPFIHSNISGTYQVLEAVREYGGRLIHVSTDEVFGELEEGHFTEESSIQPRNPYAATKAAAEHLVVSYYESFGIDAIITRCTNNYGPRQHPEKLIPKTISNILNGKKVPVYGQGLQERDWLHVNDHCEGLVAAMFRGVAGESYNFGTGTTISNYNLVSEICYQMEVYPEEVIEFVDDRPGHDFRYSIDPAKARQELDWEPSDFELVSTIDWYTEHRHLWEPLLQR